MLTEKLAGKHKIFILMSFLSYVVMAIPYTVQGSMAPVTMAYYDITAGQQGLIMTMQAVGGFGTAIFIALNGERYNKIHAIAFGLFVTGIIGGILGFAPAYTLFLAIVIVMGIGVTFVDVMMNGVISDVYTERKTVLLPFVHGFYMVGAMLVPGLVTLITDPDRPETFTRPFHVLFFAALAIAIIYLIFGRRIRNETPYINMEAMKKRVVENPAEIFKTKKAWFFIGVGLLYFSFQFGVTMWLPTYAIHDAGTDFTTAGMTLTVFFGGNLVMRFVTPLFLRVLSPRILYSVFGIISGALMVGALFTGNIVLMFVFIAAAGFTQGAMVAAFMLICIDAFPGRTASAASLTTICVSSATLTAPLWMGVMSGQVGGFLIPMLMICGCLFAASILIFFKGR